MKPALLALILTSVLHRGDRIGVVRMSDRFAYGAGQTVATAVQNDLRSELLARGFDAFDTGGTLDDLRRGDTKNAPFYVEIVSANTRDRSVGGVGVGSDTVGATVGVVVSRVAAEVRLYDGPTLALIDHFDLSKNATAIVPTSVGIGGRSFWTFIAIPFVHYGQYRNAAHEVARLAAERIAQSARE
jgi:hypothetical protein